MQRAWGQTLDGTSGNTPIFGLARPDLSSPGARRHGRLPRTSSDGPPSSTRSTTCSTNSRGRAARSSSSESPASARPGCSPSWPSARTPGVARADRLGLGAGAATCRSGCSSTRSTSTSRASSGAARVAGRRRAGRARACLAVAPGGRRRRGVPAPARAYRAHRAVRALLEQLAATKPLVLVLDDLHWADAGSVELLGALLRRPPAAPVLWRWRCGPGRDRSASRPRSSGRSAPERSTRLELGACRARRGVRAARPGSTAPSASALYEESGGNPFYLEELARSLASRGRRARAATRPRSRGSRSRSPSPWR